jgi:hypothetical protein
MRPARPIRQAVAVALVALAGLAGSGCGGGDGQPPTARPSTTAQVQIVEPKNGASLTGPAVPVHISLEGAELTDRVSTELAPDLGHLHVSLDGTLVEMNYRLDGELSDVAPGTHVMRVEFVALDHAPFNPRVFAEVSFEVGA